MISRYVAITNSQYSTTSITIMSLALFYAFSVVTATLTFLQFSRFEVVGVSLMFVVILLGCARVFRHFDGALPLVINPRNIIVAFLVTFFLIMLFSWSGRMFPLYVGTFPLLEAELGLGLHHDTAYHVSLIQSILNFGYPSIAQHGHPLTIYHVLSHYIDALILLVTGLDPYDSYGLLYHFKTFIFLSSALVAITSFTQRLGLGIYLISVGLLIPPIVGTGHAIGSHGLWMASVLLLLSAPLVFSTLLEAESVTARRVTSLFIVIVLIAFAKVSSGFMLAMVVGAILLGMRPTKPSTYVFGLVVLGFFYGYGSLFVGAKPPDISEISFGGLYNYFVSKSFFLNKISTHATQILTSIFVIGALFLSRVDRINGVALIIP